MRSRDHVYHVECFSCYTCSRPLAPGDTYGTHGDQIFCQEDYEHILNNFYNDTCYYHVHACAPSYAEYDVRPEGTDYYGAAGDFEFAHKGRSRKRRHLTLPEGCFQTLGKFCKVSCCVNQLLLS